MKPISVALKKISPSRLSSAGAGAGAVRTIATPAKCPRRPDADAAPPAAWWPEGGGGVLLVAASHGAEPLLGLAVEQLRMRCTSLLCRGFTMKSSAPAFKHLLLSVTES
jgi:hypothetical protein